MKNGKLPAYPNTNEVTADKYQGLTKREYFAGLCLQGLMANPHPDMITALEVELAEYAVNHADALLAELEKD